MSREGAPVPEFDIESASPAQLAIARAQSWAARSKRGLEVLRFRQGVALLKHPELEKGPSFRRRLDDLGITDGIRVIWERMLVCNEGEVRTRLRVPLSKLFRPAQMQRLRAHVRTTIEEALNEVEDRRDVDFMREVAWKIPSRMYCHMVSAPPSDAPTAARLADSIVAPILTANRNRRQESIDAFIEAHAWIKGLIDARRQDLGDDFTSIMIRQQMEGLLTEEELIIQCMSILQASIENTVHQTGLTFGTLLQDPARWQMLLADPARVPQAIDETLRLRPRFGTIFRYAPHEVHFEGVLIPADSWVFVSVRAANRDESMFADADLFRLDRPATAPLQFGAGPYNCLGQTLAQLEIQETVRAVLQRFPRIRLRAPWKTRDSNAVTETSQLQVALEP